MKGENIGEEEKEFISIIAILHDIGAVEAQKKYGSIDGVYQEKDCLLYTSKIIEDFAAEKNIELKGSVDGWTQEEMRDFIEDCLLYTSRCV